MAIFSNLKNGMETPRSLVIYGYNGLAGYGGCYGFNHTSKQYQNDIILISHT